MTDGVVSYKGNMPKKLCIIEGERHLKRVDRVMADIIDEFGPCDLTTRSDYFAVLCESIISQQLSVKAAETIYKRFYELFENGSLEPAKLLYVSDDRMREAGLSKQKVNYIRDLAQRFLSGEINPDKFESIGDESIVETLTKVKGIGRWTAEMFLIFALNSSDVLPVGDLGLRKAVQYQYQLEQLPDGSQIKEIAECWHPHATLATWYLWKSIGNK